MSKDTMLFNGKRLRMPYITEPQETPPTDMVDFYGDAEHYLPAVKDETGATMHMPPNIIELFETTPNDSGGFVFDLENTEADRCRHLELIMYLRSTVSAATDIIYLFFNYDFVLANYRYTYLAWSETAAVPGSATAATPTIGFMTAASGPTNDFTYARFWIPNFRSTLNVKHTYSRQCYSLGAASLASSLINHRWNKNPIRQISIRPDGYTTDTFNTSSKVQVLGHRF